MHTTQRALPYSVLPMASINEEGVDAGVCTREDSHWAQTPCVAGVTSSQGGLLHVPANGQQGVSGEFTYGYEPLHHEYTAYDVAGGNALPPDSVVNGPIVLHPDEVEDAYST